MEENESLARIYPSAERGRPLHCASVECNSSLKITSGLHYRPHQLAYADIFMPVIKQGKVIDILKFSHGIVLR